MYASSLLASITGLAAVATATGSGGGPTPGVEDIQIGQFTVHKHQPPNGVQSIDDVFFNYQASDNIVRQCNASALAYPSTRCVPDGNVECEGANYSFSILKGADKSTDYRLNIARRDTQYSWYYGTADVPLNCQPGDDANAFTCTQTADFTVKLDDST